MFSLKLKQLREELNMSQYDLAEKLHVAQSTVGMWESGKREPGHKTTTKLAAFFNVSVDELIGDDKAKPASPSRSVKIPVYGYIQAGIPIEAIEEILDYEEITPEMAATGDFFGLIIRGDSMQPRMHEGDVVIVRKQPDVDSGSVAVILVNGRDATVKKIIKTDTSLMLVPFNSAHEHTVYTAEQIEKLPVNIIGKVVELRGKFT